MDDLIAYASPAPPPGPTPQERAAMKKTRHRPNKGRKKRTDKNPSLPEPPWDMLRELGIPLPPYLANLRYTPPNWRAGETYLRWKRAVLARYGDTCHLCGHKGANTADHLIPVSVWNNQPYEPMLGRPAHGIDACPTCGIKCNSSRGNKALAIEVRDYKPPVAL